MKIRPNIMKNKDINSETLYLLVEAAEIPYGKPQIQRKWSNK